MLLEFWVFSISVLHGHIYTFKLVPRVPAQELVDSGDEKGGGEGYGKYNHQALSRKFRDLYESLACLQIFLACFIFTVHI